MVAIIGQKDTGLVDTLGNPIIREVMESRVSEATLMGVRQPVGMTVSAGLDPGGLATILYEAQSGDPESYVALAEEIEEKELQYLSVLGTRKRQVSQLDVTIQAGSTDPEDKQISDDAQSGLIDSGLIEGATFDMLDAIGKGFSLTEIVWNLNGNRWSIESLDYVDPRFVRFDRETRRNPLLRADNDGGIGLPLPPYKFAFLSLKAKSGLPIRGGLARPVAWAWMFKNFALKDWVQFCEVYGMPLRVGKFAPGADAADKQALLQAVSAISSDAACIIPSNMDIVFQDAGGKGGASDIHGALTDYLDKQISKVVIGQTSTTDATPGKLGNSGDQTQVREDIERADARALTVCINRYIVRPWVDLNYGPRDNYPWIKIGSTEPKNAALMVDTAAKLVPIGMKIRVADIRDAVGFTEPQDGDELLAAPAAAPSGGGAPPQNVPLADLNFDLNSRRRAELLVRDMMSTAAPDAIERAVQAQLDQYKEVMGPAVDQILACATDAKNFDEFMVRVRALYPSLDMTPLAKKLASLTFQAYAGGAVGHEVETRPIRTLA